VSIINCDICDRHVDTDFNAEGIWPSVDHDDMTRPDYICEGCVENLSLHDLAKLGYDADLEPLKKR
jgi:hypothetical protein